MQSTVEIPQPEEQERQRENNELSITRRLLDIRTIVSFAFAIAILVFVFTRLDVNVSAIWEDVRHSNPVLLALGFAIYYLGFPLRAVRWRLLLRNVGEEHQGSDFLPGIPRLSEILILSWFANCVVPAKIGDVYRAYLLKADAAVSFVKTAGTIFAERLIDLLILFALLVLSAFSIVQTMSTGSLIVTENILAAGIAVTVAVLAGLLGLRFFGSQIERFLPHRTRDFFSRFQTGVLGSFHRQTLPGVSALTILIWLTEAGRLYFVTQSLGENISIPIIVFAALANSLLTAVPATPGGLGVVEAGVIGIFRLVGVDGSAAASITLLDRTISYWSLILTGMVVYAFTIARRR